MSPDLLGLYLFRCSVLAVYQANTSAGPAEVQNTEYRQLCVALTFVLLSVLFLEIIAAGKCVLKRYHLNTVWSFWAHTSARQVHISDPSVISWSCCELPELLLQSINCKLYQIRFCITRIYQLWRRNFDVNVSSMQPTAHKVQISTAVKKILDVFRRPLGGWICLRGKGRTYVVGSIIKG